MKKIERRSSSSPRDPLVLEEIHILGETNMWISTKIQFIEFKFNLATLTSRSHFNKVEWLNSNHALSLPFLQKSEPKSAYSYEEPRPYRFGYEIDDGYQNKQYFNEKSEGNNVKKGAYGYVDAQGIYRKVRVHSVSRCLSIPHRKH